MIYLEMGSDIYRKEEGLAMGSPLSLVLTNIFIENLEEIALGSTSLKPSMWLRYVNETFILWSHQENVQTLQNHVNSIQSSILFTTEKEQDNRLYFHRARIWIIRVLKANLHRTVPQHLLPPSSYCKERNRSLPTTLSRSRILVSASHQTRLDTRSMTRRSITVGI